MTHLKRCLLSAVMSAALIPGLPLFLVSAVTEDPFRASNTNREETPPIEDRGNILEALGTSPNDRVSEEIPEEQVRALEQALEEEEGTPPWEDKY